MAVSHLSEDWIFSKGCRELSIQEDVFEHHCFVIEVYHLGGGKKVVKGRLKKTFSFGNIISLTNWYY